MSDIEKISVIMPHNIKLGEFSTNKIHGGQVIAMQAAESELITYLIEPLCKALKIEYPDRKITWIKPSHDGRRIPLECTPLNIGPISASILQDRILKLDMYRHSLICISGYADAYISDEDYQSRYFNLINLLKPSLVNTGAIIVFMDTLQQKTKSKNLDYFIRMKYAHRWTRVSVDVKSDPLKTSMPNIINVN